MEPRSLTSPVLADGLFATSAPWEALSKVWPIHKSPVIWRISGEKMAFRSGKEIVRDERWWPDGGVRGSRKLDPKVNRNS